MKATNSKQSMFHKKQTKNRKNCKINEIFIKVNSLTNKNAIKEQEEKRQ